MKFRRVALVCGFALGILLVMKLAPNRCVGPVQVGVDAVTAATKIGGAKSTSKSKNTTNDKKTTEPETSEGQAQFVMWQKGTDHTKPALFVDVVPRVGLGYASLLVPNKSAADETINPPPEIADMASRLRIGDVVRVVFSKPNGKFQVHALDIVKPADQDAAAKLFTYGGVRSVKVDGQDRAGVTLRRKTLSWTFLVPAGGAAIVPVASTAGPKPAPLSQEWSDSLARFRVGDQVFVDYDVADYQFILKDVAASQMAIHGTFLRTGKDTTQGAKGSPTVVVQCGAREITLLLPEQGTALNGAPAGDASAYPSLKGVVPGQEVDVKYHKEAAVLWLDEIVAAKK